MTILRTVLLDDNSGGFGPGDTGSNNQETQSAATTINTFVEGVLATSDFPSELEGAPDLKKHQEEARQMGYDWKHTVRIVIYKSNANLIRQSSQFLNFYQILWDLAGELDDDDKREQLIQGVDLLQKRVKDTIRDTEEALEVLQGFDVNLNTVVQTIRTDRESVRAIYEGDEGQLKNLEDQLAANEAARKVNIGIIAGGAGAVVVGGLAIVAGVFLAIPSGGVTTTVIGGGVVFVAGGSTAMGIAAENLKKNNEEIERLTKEIALLEASIALLSNISEDLDLLGEQGAEAVKACDLLLRSWQVLVTELEALKETVADCDPDYGIFIRGYLDTAKDQWEEVDYTAELIKEQLIGIPVEIEPDSAAQVQLADSLTTLVGSRKELSAKFVKYGSNIPIYMDAATSSWGVGGNLKAMVASFSKLSAVLREQPVDVVVADHIVQRVTSVTAGIEAASMSISHPLRIMVGKIIPKLEKLANEPFVVDNMSSMREEINALTPQLVKVLRNARKLQKKMKTHVSTCGQSVAEVTAAAFSYESDDATTMKSLARLREELLTANKSLGSGRKNWYELATGISAETLIDRLVEHAHETLTEKKDLKEVAKKRNFEDVVSSSKAVHRWLCSVAQVVSSLHDEMGGFINVLKSMIFELDLLGTKATDSILCTWAERQCIPVISSFKKIVEAN